MRVRKCWTCGRLVPDPDHPWCSASCKDKTIRSWEAALAVAMSPEGRRFRAKKAVWATRIRKGGGQVGRLSLADFEARWDYYRGRCWMCGDEATQTDHVIPLSKGGSGWASNIRPACPSCSRKKRDRHPREFASVAAFVTWCRRSPQEDVLILHAQGDSLRNIAKAVGLSYEAVRLIVGKANAP